MTFDPSWTLEEAMRAGEMNGGDILKPDSPFTQWYAYHKVMRLEEKFKTGSRPSVLLDAVYQCALHDIVMPEWVSMAYLKAYRKVLRYECGSWDEAFGEPNPPQLNEKGESTKPRLNRLKKARKLRLKVYLEVENKRKEGRPLDSGLFTDVGKNNGVSKTQAVIYYYEVKNAFKAEKKRFDEYCDKRDLENNTQKK